MSEPHIYELPHLKQRKKKVVLKCTYDISAQPSIKPILVLIIKASTAITSVESHTTITSMEPYTIIVTEKSSTHVLR